MKGFDFVKHYTIAIRAEEVAEAVEITPSNYGKVKESPRIVQEVANVGIRAETLEVAIAKVTAILPNL